MKASTRGYEIAVIPGDGIGAEVTIEAVRVLERAGSLYDFSLRFKSFPWGSDFYFKHGTMMPDSALHELRSADAILLGAVGDPRIADHLTLGGLLLPIRRAFQQFANVRPSHLFEGVSSPLKDRAPGSIDLLVVRENTEGEYAHVGGRVHTQSTDEVAIQTAVFTRRGSERVIRYAFEWAKRRSQRKKVTSITKSNAQGYGMVLWDEVFRSVAAGYPDIQTESLLVDAACMDLIRRPTDFDVIVASNLFGDIISEITAAITGGLGLAPSANINPPREYPSMFEPVHGSAPDIAGQGISNPIATILAAQMMLEHLGETEAAKALHEAVGSFLRRGKSRTPDLGGDSKTCDVTDEIIACLESPQDPIAFRRQKYRPSQDRADI